ncbi:MAG TPA: Ig-like domain-containing protein [Actinomycetota bacterium]|nr:Ig-like domain-containing protein [Actinomycetota bacterium]
MRRSLSLVLATLACLAVLPVMSAAAAAAASVAVTPVVETIVTGAAHAPVATVRDASGNVLSGVAVDWQVTDGGHAADDLDGNATTPPGYIGRCQTNASGFCSVTWTGTRVTVDTVRALVDLNGDGTAGSGEPAATATADWRAAGNGPSALRIDMHGCDGDTAAPIDAATWNVAGPATAAGGVATICAARFTSADALAAGPVTFTITGGPGVLTDATGAADHGTSLEAQAAGGVNTVFVRSTLAGTTTVRASFGSVIADGTAAWIAGAARTIALAGPAAAVSGSTVQVTATVRDRFDNPVPGVAVVFSEDGPGGFTGGAASINATTGPGGAATAAVATEPGQVGSQTVAASISPADTDCELAAADPAGAPAGVCRAEAVLGWIEAPPELSLLVSPDVGVWGTDFAISGVLSAGSSGIAGKNIVVSSRPAGAGPAAWTQIAIATTDENGLFVITSKPSMHTEYRAVFPGGSGYDSAVSGTDRADVRVGLHMTPSARTLRAGRPVVLAGRILPEHGNHPVHLQQLTASGWRTIATTRTDASSSYRFRVVKRSPGGLLFRTVTPSDFHHAWNASLNRRVDWR